MNDLFHQAPVIARNSRGLLYVQADFDLLDAAGRDRLESLAVRYGPLVLSGYPLRGGQWARQIELRWGDQPGVAQDVQFIRSVMAADRYADDRILTDSHGHSWYRGSAQACAAKRLNHGPETMLEPVAESSALRVHEATTRMAATALAEFGAWLACKEDRLAHGCQSFASHVFGEEFRVDAPAGGQLAAALSLLQHRCVGRETFSDEQNSNEQAAYVAMAALVSHLGYTSFVTSKPPKGQPHTGAQPVQTSQLDAQGIAERLEGFLANMIAQGWDPGNAVFLCRPAPAVNPVGSVREF